MVADRKIETLEEEMKLLKGEVRHTLLDLRAYLMRQDSPLTSRGPVDMPDRPTRKEQVSQKQETQETAPRAEAPRVPHPDPVSNGAPPTPGAAQVALPRYQAQYQPNAGGSTQHERQSAVQWDNRPTAAPAGEPRNVGNGTRPPDPPQAGVEATAQRNDPPPSRTAQPREAAPASRYQPENHGGYPHPDALERAFPNRARSNSQRRPLWGNSYEAPGDPRSTLRNINLASGLMRWVSLVKGRTGSRGLGYLLDLYGSIWPISPEVERNLYLISVMVDEPAEEGIQVGRANDCMDLLCQLHGMLTSDCPPTGLFDAGSEAFPSEHRPGYLAGFGGL